MTEELAAERGILSGFELKILAAAAMLVDHAGAILFPEAMWMRCVGRLAFPIYCFLLVEGFCHTKDVNAYLKRLFVFALVSEVIFDYAFMGTFVYFGHQNVFFTLSISLFLLKMLKEEQRYPVQAAYLVGAALAAELLCMDYGAGGVLTVLFFYRFRGNKPMLALSVGLLHVLLWGSVQGYAVLALIPIFLYNGK